MKKYNVGALTKLHCIVEKTNDRGEKLQFINKAFSGLTVSINTREWFNHVGVVSDGTFIHPYQLNQHLRKLVSVKHSELSLTDTPIQIGLYEDNLKEIHECVFLIKATEYCEELDLLPVFTTAGNFVKLISHTEVPQTC